MQFEKSIKISIAVLALSFATGWEPIPEDPNLNGIAESKTSGQGGTIYVRYLPDGTKCAVLDGFRAGGLDCDWAGESEKRRYQEPEPRPKEEGSYYER